MPIVRFINLFFLVFLSAGLLAQSPGQDTNEKESESLISLQGGLRLTSGFYSNLSGQTLRTSPFSYGIGGNLSLSIGKFQVPIALTFRDHSLSLSRPFFYLGASPTIGKLRLHLGNSNLAFSKYTLGGATFFGVGAETNFGKLRVGAMAGTFQNPFAQRDSIVYGAIELPTFDRKGYAVRLGFGSHQNFFDLIILKVKDDFKENVDNEAIVFKPKDNLVIGTVFRRSISRQFTFRADAAISGLTNDLSYDYIELEDDFIENIRGLFDINLTTNISYAGEAELKFRSRKFNSSFLYRRVSPYYESYGINFLTQDREDFLLRFNGRFLDNSIRFVTSIGIQRNNLFEQRSDQTNRFIGSFTLLYKGKGPFSLNARYNNYSFTNEPTVVEDNDSLKLARVMNNFNVRPSYKFETSNIDHTLGVTVMYRLITGEFGFEGKETKNNYCALSYGMKLKEQELSFKLNTNFNRNRNLSFTRDRYGMTLSVTKPLLDNKLRLSWINSFYSNLINSKNDGRTLRSGINANCKLASSQGLALYINYLWRESIVFQDLQDIQGRITYNISF